MDEMIGRHWPPREFPMKNLTHRFALGSIDHDELLHLFGVRYQSSWQASRNEVDFPAAKSFSIRVTHDHGRIRKIFAGPALVKKRDIEALVADVEANLMDPSVKEYGRGMLLAPKPVKGVLQCPSAGVQLLPPPGGTPHPDWINAEHPFVIEFPIRVWHDPALRFWRRRKNLVEWAWVLTSLLDTTVRVQAARSRSMWVRTPGDGGRFLFLNEQAPYEIGDIFAPALSVAEPPLKLVPAAIYYADWGIRGRAGLPVDELLLPDNLNESMGRFYRLEGIQRARFLQAASTIYVARQLWDESISAFFLACVQAIECVAQELPRHGRAFLLWKRPIGPSRRFRQICERHGAAAGVDRKTLTTLYETRSKLVHGEYVFEFDARPWGLGNAGSVFGMDDLDAADSVVRLAKAVLRDWLRSQK